MRIFFLGLGMLVLAACNQPADTDTSTEASTPGLKIAYVNTDSVLSQFDYLEEQMAILGKREQEASANLQRKAMQFQEQVGSFQRRAQSGNLTPKQIENEQRTLAEREQNLSAEQQRLAMEFQGEGARLESEVVAILKREVDALQKELGYDFILSYGGTSNVLAVNPDYNLTSQVIARMNANPKLGEGDLEAIGQDTTAQQ
jgi:Outer membrane protein